MKRRTSTKSARPTGRTGVAAAMAREGFHLRSGEVEVWFREADGVELFVMDRKALRTLAEPATLFVSAPGLTGGSEALVSLRFPSVSALLAAVRGGHVGPH
jgi:hypothetical protein